MRKKTDKENEIDEEIKLLFSKIKQKTEFCVKLAKALKLNPAYVHIHFFYGKRGVPIKYQNITKSKLEFQRSIDRENVW